MQPCVVLPVDSCCLKTKLPTYFCCECFRKKSKMFDRENGEMLPRPAPKPITPPNENMFKPTVPEVSILFDQKNQQQQQQQQLENSKSPPKKPQTYAAWKKQNLPHVVYPLSERDNLLQNEAPRNELYPMRTPLLDLPPMSQMPATYNYELPFYYNGVPARPTTAPTYTQALYPPQRRSLDAIATQTNDMYRYGSPAARVASGGGANEVLTLCASTQTDAELTRGSEALSPQTLRQFATKSDVEQLMDVVQQIRHDQLRLVHILENLVVSKQQQQQPLQQQQQQADTQTTETGTQSEQKTENASETVAKETAATQTDTFAPARFQTPRLPPAAQSTAYQGHTPPGILRRSASGHARKPTDKTLTMNELALKYLPDDKLHELMSDMQLAGSARNPVMERVMIASKAPTDMSNASYKYLKKYRLLPEEEAAGTPKTMRFHLEDTRHSQPNSPYEQRPVDSPMMLRRAASEGVNVNEERSDLINLEDLRNQPKFM